MVYTLREIADIVEGEVVGDDQVVIKGINSLENAMNKELSFFIDRRYRDGLNKTKAVALLVFKETDNFKGPQIVVPNPSLAYAKVASLFAPPEPDFSGISPAAEIHENSKIEPGASIYPMVYVGEEVFIAEDVILFPGVFIGDRVKIGAKTVIYPNVTILHDCLIGQEVTIHAGTVIGSDGFGFVRNGTANIKIPHNGIVRIDDHVEIGAGNTIDRATLGKTWIKRGVKTDNLIHIGHNVVIGEDTIIVAQAGISGSVHIGREVVIGGQVGISDHLKIGDRAMIGSRSGLAKSVAPGEVVSGTPSMPHRLWLKTRGLITRLPQLFDRLRRLEKKADELEKRIK